MPKSKNPDSKKTELQSVKGMRDLIGNNLFLYQGFFEKAAEVALYYGFKPIETPILEQESLFTRGVGDETDIVTKEMYTLRTRGKDKLALRPEGTAPVMRAYFEHGMQSEPQPIMLYYFGPFFRHENPQFGRWRQFYQFGLEILGTKKSIADATIIRLTILILKEAGLNNLTVKINSIGDAECRPAYRRELINYYKKNLRHICSDCKERIKSNPLRVLDCKNPKCETVRKAAPESVSYLCAPCKKHFKEVLEYLDMMQISYEIDHTLVRGIDYYSHTVFEIICQPEESTPTKKKPLAVGTSAIVDDKETKQAAAQPLSIAGGGRYDSLANSLKAKKNVPGVGVSIGVDRIIGLPQYAQLSPRIVKPAKIFFIQISFEAKLKCFEVIEILRAAKIPIAQSLAKDSLSAQLGIAEKMKIPYTIILGQKEAMENTVIIRNMENRSQDTVAIDKLAQYLKKIK